MEGQIFRQTVELLEDFLEQNPLKPDQILVVGTSTSEVLGHRIGTQGNEAVAREIYEAIESIRKKSPFHVAFQCCEHLNRALVVEKETAQTFGLEEVWVVPVPEAGGSMAAYAYRHLAHAVVVEKIQAHAGIDIGGTLIGMHLRPVAVPVRSKVKQVGQAPVILAKTRPKLIGGARAVYEKK